jgi:hypothetical protein
MHSIARPGIYDMTVKAWVRIRGSASQIRVPMIPLFARRACMLAVSVVWAVTPAALAAAAPGGQDWVTYTNQAAGQAFAYPASVFSEQPGDPTDALKNQTTARAGRIFRSLDGKAILQIGTISNIGNATVDSLRKRAIAASYTNAKIDYNRLADNWYVLSGTRGSETFYERVHFSCNNRRIDVWALTYPAADNNKYNPIVDEMARRFRPILDRIRC